MDGQSVYQISLLAAFIAGMVALFAPCCISYLLPAYLGNVFKERKQVLFMTLVYSLGIFVILMPVVLGARVLSSFFFQMHDNTYIFGGVLMIFVSILAFIGIKLPMPHFSMQQKGGQKTDILSTFTLGIFSGITSACCAPVLIGVMALSSLTPTTLQAVGVGAVYVLGMVTPLYLASLFLHKGNIMEKPFLKKKVTQIALGEKIYPIFVSNIIGGLIFLVTGILMLILTLNGKLAMNAAEQTFTESINRVAVDITNFVGGIPGIDIIFVIVGGYLLYLFIKEVFGSKGKE